LSEEAQRRPVWLQASESILCSRLSGEAPWVAFAPVGDGLMECDVVLHLAEDPIALYCLVSHVLGQGSPVIRGCAE